MKILVTNPTGRISRRILRELVAPEFTVRVIVRDPTRLPLELRREVEVVRGSADDVRTLRWALEDIESVFWCIPPATMAETDVLAHYVRFAHAARTALAETRTPRVVTISAQGELPDGAAGPIAGLRAMETSLKDSGAAVRHLRCGWFMDNLLDQLRSIQQAGLFGYCLAADVPVPMVAINDVVDLALRWLVRRDWEGVDSFAIACPERLSFGRAAIILQEILDRPLRYKEMSRADFIQQLRALGATAQYACAQADLLTQLAGKPIEQDSNPLAAPTPTTLMAWAEKELLSSAHGPGASEADLVFLRDC